MAFVIGGLTAVVAAAIMLTQSDIKTMLGFSTIGQMGYMIMECGLGAFALAIFHLIAHGLFKATVFLNCGNVIHMARQEPRFPPGHIQEKAEALPRFPWATGVVMTLLLPLIILLAAHGVLQVPLRDAQGAVIVGAEVSVENTATGDRHSAVTDSSGTYSILQLPPATYVVNIHAPGFSPGSI